MVEVTREEAKMIVGGKNKWTIGVIIGVVATFIAGIIDGYLRPLSCNS